MECKQRLGHLHGLRRHGGVFAQHARPAAWRRRRGTVEPASAAAPGV